MLRFAVVADSHFHPAAPGRPTQAAWDSDASFGARNAAVVEAIRGAGCAFVVHLGDVVHPVPGLAEHEPALAAAKATYDALDAPLFVVPGNHDVGDKPHPWAPAPSVSAAKHATFERWWGPPWWAREVEGVRLVGVDTPVLNSGLALEEAQWAWLEETLVADGPRTFIFLHYPPFLLDPDEAEHYDNVAEPARGRLLALFARARVEAVFCGHVHHPFWTRTGPTDWYVLPSTAFVRPEYSELARVGPGPEFGRDDRERLGFVVVDVNEQGHTTQFVRSTEPQIAARPRTTPLAITLRGAWDAVVDLPAAGLEPFRRKRARDDLALLATWELGVHTLRVPLDDLRRPETRARMALVAERGQRFVLFTADPLDDEVRRLVEAMASAIRAVELVVPRTRLDAELPALAVPRLVAAYGRGAGEVGAYFNHFTPTGFVLHDEDLTRARGDGVVYRCEADPVSFVGTVAARGGLAEVVVALPGAGESREAGDDEAVTAIVEQAHAAAVAQPEVLVALDLFVDHDRGYHPRHGLLDRRHHPRPAFLRLRERAGSGRS